VPSGAAIVPSEPRHPRAYPRFVVHLPVPPPPIVSVLLLCRLLDPGPGLVGRLLDLLPLPPLAWLVLVSGCAWERRR
jgi:hypothetical protein